LISHKFTQSITYCSLCLQLRIFVNQLYQTQVADHMDDLLAIRMASVNPILDPWIYILLRKTVVLKLVERIKCLFCKMGVQGASGGPFLCLDAQLTSSIVSHDSPSLMRVNRGISMSTQCPSEGSLDRGGLRTGRPAESHAGSSLGSPSTLMESFLLEGQQGTAEEEEERDVEGPAEETEWRCVFEPSGLTGLRCTGIGTPSLKGLGMGAKEKDRALNVTFTGEEAQSMQEKCI